MTRVIGLISGTSVDGIDAAMVNITGTELDLKLELIDAATYCYPTALRKQILAVCAGEPLSMEKFAHLDDAIAVEFAKAALTIQANNPPAELIGSHGQTVYHRPPGQHSTDPDTTHPPFKISPSLGYSLQLGRGALIAQLTGMPTVSNFRAADIAAGGQGAPLVSKIDVCVLSHPQRSRCVQNIGGIGNVTYLPGKAEVIPDTDRQQLLAWDTGPGNTLLDLAVQHLTQGEKSYDENGAWAATGTPCHALIEHWLEHPFFHLSPPKSTGRELFGWDYFQQCLADAEGYQLSSADLLATLTELTVASIVHNYRSFLPVPPDEVFLCGGGSRNRYLTQRLVEVLQATYSRPVAVLTTDEAGLNADFKEAIAFAILAYWRQLGIPGNLPECTGARVPLLLGDLHIPIP